MTEFVKKDPPVSKNPGLNARIAKLITNHPDEWFMVVEGAENRHLADRISRGLAKDFESPNMQGSSEKRSDGRYNIYARYNTN